MIHTNGWFRRFKTVLMLTCASGVLIVSLFGGIGSSSQIALSEGPTVKFAFDQDFMGWEHQTNKDLACTEVLVSKKTNTKGSFSLAMSMDLIAGDPRKGQGEAFVNLKDNPLQGERAPIDMTNRTVSAWIFVPKDQGARGDTDAPNGFQVFVRDDKGFSEYGTWDNQFDLGQWYKISLVVSKTQPKDGFMAKEFDPTKIVTIGVKMGTGTGSKATYKGLIYIDDISW